MGRERLRDYFPSATQICLFGLLIAWSCYAWQADVVVHSVPPRPAAPKPPANPCDPEPYNMFVGWNAVACAMEKNQHILPAPPAKDQKPISQWPPTASWILSDGSQISMDVVINVHDRESLKECMEFTGPRTCVFTRGMMIRTSTRWPGNKWYPVDESKKK